MSLDERPDTKPAKTERSYKCPSCGGVVAIPERRRTIDLIAVRAVHEMTCPGVRRRLM